MRKLQGGYKYMYSIDTVKYLNTPGHYLKAKKKIIRINILFNTFLKVILLALLL